MSLLEKDVRELQEIAREAPGALQRKARKPLSRAARLDLIDMLSRWSGSGLAVIAGAGVYLAATAGRGYPTRAAAWAFMMLGALWVCRRLRAEFRSGRANASRPFRWRASYTSCLSVLGVILASAPILLTPVEAPAPLFLHVSGLTLFAAACAAMLHAAHFASAAAIAAPAAILAVMASVRAGDGALIAGAAGAALLCICAVYVANRAIVAKARRRHPRTTFLRREIVDWRKGAADRSSGQVEDRPGAAADAAKTAF